MTRPTKDTSTALVVHESMFGNTSAVSVAVARGLRGAGYAVTEGEVNRVAPAITPDFDLVVLGRRPLPSR